MTGFTEDLHGIGKLSRGGVVIGEVEYSIRVYLAGEQRWAYPFAQFRPRQNLDFYGLVGQRVTLYLEDGRQWDCLIQSLDGKVTAAGDWPTKREHP